MKKYLTIIALLASTSAFAEIEMTNEQAGNMAGGVGLTKEGRILTKGTDAGNAKTEVVTDADSTTTKGADTVADAFKKGIY